MWNGPKKALRAGKHVLCEKPIALKAEEIDELIALREQTGLQVAEAFMIVHHPQWIRARGLFRDGVLGNLRHVDGVFSYFNDDMDNIRNQAQFGGGGIRDIGVYTYGSARFVTRRGTLESHPHQNWLGKRCGYRRAYLGGFSGVQLQRPDFHAPARKARNAVPWRCRGDATKRTV